VCRASGCSGSFDEDNLLPFRYDDHHGARRARRRAETLQAFARPRSGAEPVHLLVDSTGLKLSGAGAWLLERHGTKTRRFWSKLHRGVDAGTGQIVTAQLTTNDVDDGSQVGPLLDQMADPVASFAGDGAYDRDDVYSAVNERHPDAAVIVPPRSSAVSSETAEIAPTQRDQHLQLIAKDGRMVWQKASRYNWRRAGGGHQPLQTGDRRRTRHGRPARHRGCHRFSHPEPDAGAWASGIRAHCVGNDSSETTLPLTCSVQQGHVTLHSAHDGRMGNRQVALGRHCHQVQQTQRKLEAPAHAKDDYRSQQTSHPKTNPIKCSIGAQKQIDANRAS
jgi:hypothetical protein